MKKKAVSPLIATVLLIAFAVALGAVVMNWGRTQFTVASSSGLCSSVDIRLESVGDNPGICYSKAKPNTVEFLLENAGKKSVSKFKITVFSDRADPYNGAIEQAVAPADSKRLEFTYPANFGTVQKVKITPVLVPDLEEGESKLQAEEEVCVDHTIEAIQIGNC